MSEPSTTQDDQRGPLRRFVGNLGSLLTSTVVERALRFVVYAAVARMLGPTPLGQLALAMAVLQLVSRIAVLGIPMLATREVARSASTTRAYLVRGGLLATGAALVGYLAVGVFSAATNYEDTTYTVIWVLLIGLVPFCWSRITEAILIGLEEARFVAAVNVPVNLLQVGVAIVLLQRGYEVVAVALTLALSFFLVAVLQGAAILIRTKGSAVADGPEGREIVRTGGPFLGVQATVVVRTTASTFIVSLILGEAAVGLFSAAQQLQMPLRVVGTVVASALFPVMSRAYRRAADAFSVVVDRSLELTFAILLPGAAGLIVLADDLLALVFGDAGFEDAATVLRLLAVAALATTIASIMGRALMAADRETVTLRIAVVNSAALVAVGIVFTYWLGLNGAALAGLTVALLNVAQHYEATRRVAATFSLVTTSWRPLAATVLMALFLIAAGGLPVIPLILLGAVVYVAAFVGVSLLATGGKDELVEYWRLGV